MSTKITPFSNKFFIFSTFFYNKKLIYKFNYLTNAFLFAICYNNKAKEGITMNEYIELANLIFPNVTETIEDLEKRYPPRNLNKDALITRFAPSPTGFLHTGSLFMTLVNYRFAKQTNGLFYIRLEDTDQKREIKGTGITLLNELKEFNIIPDEGYLGDHEEGKYAPYIQSKRANIYDIVIKELIKRGLAYPCFMSSEELEELRRMQEKKKIRPGCYGKYAKYHSITPKEAIERIKNNEPYVIRFKSSGNELNKISVYDEIRGKLELTENDLDIIIRKKDGLPTYHFAHLVDDHFMRTNLVIRGEEWLPSLPIHYELFKTMNWQFPKYAHTPTVQKVSDTGGRRKLSKRYDEEAAVSYFFNYGYPKTGLIEYLLTIINSNFEEWRLANPYTNNNEFKLSFDKFSSDGALFDMDKVKNICKEVLSKMTKKEITDETYTWASTYDLELKQLIDRDRSYFEEIMNIEREIEKPRKDYEKYSDIKESILFFYDDYYNEMLKEELPFNSLISKEDTLNVLNTFKKENDPSLNETDWFNNLKRIATLCGFCDNVKEYKKNKEAYKGHIGDVASIIRITMCTKTKSPNLYNILQILGKDRYEKRIEQVIAKIK